MIVPESKLTTVLEPGTHYIVRGDNNLEVAFVLKPLSSAPVLPGNRVIGGFLIRDGEVTDQAVAVRTLDGVGKEICSRFFREAALCFEPVNGWLNPYEYIAEPLFSGMCLTSPDELIPVFIRKLIRGTSLSSYIKKNGPLSEQKALRFISQIAQGLCVAHGNNVIHKCLKPSNIIVADDGERVTITDFGSGCFLSREVLLKLDTSDELIHYLSPEQVKGTIGIDLSADIFALGALLYFLVTGEHLFAGDTRSKVFAAITKDEKQIDHHLISSYTRGLITVMVSLDAGKRFRSAGHFLAELPGDICSAALARVASSDCFRCYQCGEHNFTGAHFCSFCGRDFSFRCSKCRSFVYGGANFCRSCGEMVTRGLVDPCLIGLRGGFAGKKLDLNDCPVRLGRHKQNDISFAGLDKYVSRYQSRIRMVRNQFWIESGYMGDGKTTNGTFVNGINIDGKGLVILKRGDKVRMGDSFFRFVF